MSWTLIAQKEIGDLRRNRQLYGMAVLFAAMFGLLGYIHANSVNDGFGSPNELVMLIGMLGTYIIPAVALMLSYETIVKRRHNGQLELLLGFPHHRRDLVLGGYVGRFLVVATVIVAGLWACGMVVVLMGATVLGAAYMAFLFVSLVLALAYTAAGITISASVRSPSWASVATFSVYLMFVLAWRIVPSGLAYLLNGFERPATSPWWTEYVLTLSPNLAVEEIFVWMLPESTAESIALAGSGSGVEFAAVVLLAWIVLLPLAGYLRFDRTDL
ncbi:ABC-type transport system involved in multi-copper enzyme maturation, permease component [Halovivax ruber XH-70]|uniref:ABC-type transport system involved in multi-copper enzyme maturation, permease component n=1 Tax=Halovivax ruber (strain DSM 18193 / JCM 13892 / XH-70) TaxID=797302 RepID=L0IAZ4_HALRX|nr:ABC transporter permease subunit [Halovivax ruber]AGB15127.1 ABC-type transport system involved in multi-copper enzyme maturation, permease component [Halovivax ruber XH-70]